MDEHPLCRVFYLYYKQIEVEIDADMRLLASMLISFILQHCAEGLPSS